MGHIDTNGHRIRDLELALDTLNGKYNKMVNSVLLLQLHAIGKVDLTQMSNLVKMLNSPDEESHTIAIGIIDGMLQTL